MKFFSTLKNIIINILRNKFYLGDENLGNLKYKVKIQGMDIFKINLKNKV